MRIRSDLLQRDHWSEENVPNQQRNQEPQAPAQFKFHLRCLNCSFCVDLIKIPVSKVDVKISTNGIHVPRRLVNISKLLLISMATTKTSIAITKKMYDGRGLQGRCVIEFVEINQRYNRKEDRRANGVGDQCIIHRRDSHADAHRCCAQCPTNKCMDGQR
jgi:hypothetical protein